MNLVDRWLAGPPIADALLEQLAASEDRSRPRPGRFAERLPRPRGRSRFAQELERWLAINHWTPSQFAALTDRCRDPSLILPAREINAVISGSRLELMPRHFRAFAAVERLTRSQRIAPLLSDQDLIACFATSICSDESSLQPSWWFAVYCGEDWAMERLREPASAPVLELAALRRIMPPLLRNALAANGLDPVAHLRGATQQLPRGSGLRPQRFVDWILEYDRLDERELRLAIAFTLLLMSDLGRTYASLLEVQPLEAGMAPEPTRPVGRIGRPSEATGSA